MPAQVVVLIKDVDWWDDTITAESGEVFAVADQSKESLSAAVGGDEEYRYSSQDAHRFHQLYAEGELVILEQTHLWRGDRQLWIRVFEEEK